MPYKFKEIDLHEAKKMMTVPSVVLKIIPDLDGSIRIAELVRFEYSVTVKGAWKGPGSLDLFHNAAVPLAALPVREIVSVVHTHSESWIEGAKVVHDYTKENWRFTILGFIGIDDVQTVRAEGMNIPPLAIHAVPNGEKAVDALVI
jgi:hypothetical protein